MVSPAPLDLTYLVTSLQTQTIAMDPFWQQLAVGMAVVAALAYIGSCVWRLVRVFRGGAGGGSCGSCSKCPSTAVGNALPLITLDADLRLDQETGRNI